MGAACVTEIENGKRYINTNGAVVDLERDRFGQAHLSVIVDGVVKSSVTLNPYLVEQLALGLMETYQLLLSPPKPKDREFTPEERKLIRETLGI